MFSSRSEKKNVVFTDCGKISSEKCENKVVLDFFFESFSIKRRSPEVNSELHRMCPLTAGEKRKTQRNGFKVSPGGIFFLGEKRKEKLLAPRSLSLSSRSVM